jgi:hypothetical protein
VLISWWGSPVGKVGLNLILLVCSTEQGVRLGKGTMLGDFLLQNFYEKFNPQIMTAGPFWNFWKFGVLLAHHRYRRHWWQMGKFLSH